MSGRKTPSSGGVVAVIIAAMLGLTVWLLIQMAPETPAHGTNLILIALVFLVMAGVVVPFLVIPELLHRRRRRHRDDR